MVLPSASLDGAWQENIHRLNNKKYIKLTIFKIYFIACFSR